MFVELRNLHRIWIMSFIESTGVTCSDSISHNWVQVLSIPVLLLVCSQDWTCNLQIIVSLEALGTNANKVAGLDHIFLITLTVLLPWINYCIDKNHLSFMKLPKQKIWH